jgi:hypothetical protein
MKPIGFALSSLLFLAFLSSTSTAQVQRTFVSGLGNDGNPCTLAAPCRTFGQAISQTNPGGEVVAVDSAGYGAFTVSKAISVIAAPGAYAGISVFSGHGIDINAGSSDTVILRGLTLNSQGNLTSGIVFNTGKLLHVESCVVNGFLSAGTSNGLAALGQGNLEVKDSIFRGNGNGIFVLPSSGTVAVTIDHVRLERNNSGLLADIGSQVSVSDSIVSGNLAGLTADSGAQMNLVRCVVSNNIQGVVGQSSSTNPTQANVESCLVSNNGDGLFVDQTSTGVVTLRVSGSTVTGNLVGLFNQAGNILSRGNNTVEGNTTDTMGTIGSYTAK